MTTNAVTTVPGPRRRLALPGGLAVVTALSLAAAGGDVGSVQSVPSAASSSHVVLISIDGFAAYHLDDPSIDLPNIRALAAAGARAASSETVFPSVTHPSHTTLVTGTTPRVHGVVNNRVRNRATGERLHITNLPRRQSVRTPTLFDAVHAQGRPTAAFFWPETREDAAIDVNVAEVLSGPDEVADSSVVAPELLQELRAAGVPIDSYYAFYDNPFTQGAADVALTQAAGYVFSRRRPALTAVHLLVTDKVQHEVGPDHYAARAALTTADYCVGLLRTVVAEAGLSERTTFVIASDHGFATVPFEMNIAPLLRDPALDGRVQWHADGWYVFAELLPSFDAGTHGPLLERLLARIARMPHIARIIRPADVAALGYPDYADNVHVPGQYIVVADLDTRLLLDGDRTPSARRRRAQPYHGHGYLPSHPKMYPALVLSGAGIAPGSMLGHVKNIDVAPTIAELLGVALPTATGAPLRAALR